MIPVCSECGAVIGFTPESRGWEDVPVLDEEFLRTDNHGHPLRRRFVCSAITADGAYSNAPRKRDGRCYDPDRHVLYAGTCRTGWALINERRHRGTR